MAKIKTDFSDLKALLPKLRQEIINQANKVLKTSIVDESISKGISPVQGEGRYQRYSDSYRQAIQDGRYKQFGKKISPVNLKLDGTMLDSFFVEKTGQGFKVGFSHWLSEIHTVKGAGRSRTIRKMLPVGKNEQFKRTIIKDIIDLIQNAADRILGK